MTDDQLLHEFISRNAQDAFAEIVHRHIDAVYASARRQVHDPQTAEDVAQAVFILLAKKANNLTGRESLAGWLMKTTYFAAQDAKKKSARRTKHEQNAAKISQSRKVPDMNPETEKLSPELDEALAQLSEPDRGIVALRYLQGKTTNETATALRISEPAAAKRITRAVDRLRRILLRKGAIAPTVMVAALLDELPRISAPASLAKAAVAATTSGTTTSAGHAIAKGVIQMTKWNQIKAAIVMTGTVLIIAGAGIGTVRLLAQATPSQTESPASPPADLPAQPSNSSGRPLDVTGRLNNGISLGLVGISENPSAGKPWWKANGLPLDSAPYTHLGAKVMAQPGQIPVEVAVKIHRSLAAGEDATIHWNLDNSDSNAGNGNDLPDLLEASAFSVQDDPKGATLRAKIAAGPWTTEASDSIGGLLNVIVLNKSFIFSQPFQVNGETHLIVSATGISDMDHRLQVIDQNGRPHIARPLSIGWTDALFMGEFVLPGKIKSFAQCALQTRPFDQWIVISGIALHPGQVTNPKVTTSDNP